MRQVFTVRSDEAELLGGPWSAAPGDDASFGVDGEAGAPPGVDLWSADFSADPAVAAQELRAGFERQRLADEQLRLAERRLNDVQLRGIDVAFDTSTPDAERELSIRLSEIKAAYIDVSFDVGAAPAGALGEAVAGVQGLLDRMVRSLSHLAWVDTRVEGRLYARTVVEWNGTMQTAWHATGGAAQASLHWNTLDLACAGRLSALNKVALVVRGAVVLSSLLAPTGIGTLLALPSALQFVNDVLAEVQQR